MKNYLHLPSFLLLLTLTGHSAIGAGVPIAYSVTNLNDSGPGSLRAGLLVAAASKTGTTISFATSGTIMLASPLPTIGKPVTIDGATAPGFAAAPVVGINFDNNTGLLLARGATGSVIDSLSLTNSGNAAITLQASEVTVQGNYIGLKTNGATSANYGDGIAITYPSSANLIGNDDPVESITYANTSNVTDFTIQPVSAWQGLRNDATTAGQDLICGTSDANGLLYIGPFAGGGTSYAVQYPGGTITSTSVYGPDNISTGEFRLVGSYKNSADTTIFNHGFVWTGTPSELPTGGTFTSIDYPGATHQFTHSTMQGLAVGNADGPAIGAAKAAVGGEVAYIYNVGTSTFISNIAYPGARTTTAYGIWYNAGTVYTICGGYSTSVASNLVNESQPLALGKAYMVDYDSSTNKFSNWTSYSYPNGAAGVAFASHFEGISSSDPGTYTLVADSVQSKTANPAQGSWVTVRRNANGLFGAASWVDLNYPAVTGVSSANSVYGNQVVGLVVGPSTFPYQATVNIGFQLSNVISGNRGNGISLTLTKDNIISMNYIGTDPAGDTNAGFGNFQNGILVTERSTGNLIGGQATGGNNPTGTKGTVTAVFQQPPQGNLISGNHGDGVLIAGVSSANVLSGNFIGTNVAGTAALGNLLDGVDIESSSSNSLIGCTLFQNPFVFYNVIGGNRGNGGTGEQLECDHCPGEFHRHGRGQYGPGSEWRGRPARGRYFGHHASRRRDPTGQCDFGQRF